MKIPKNLALCADTLAGIVQEISVMNAQLKLMNEQRIELEAHLINNLSKGDASGIAGKRARVQIITEDIPTVENWDKFYAYIGKTEEYDLLQRRVSIKAVRERWELHRAVPGVAVFAKVSVKLSILKRKEKA